MLRGYGVSICRRLAAPPPLRIGWLQRLLETTHFKASQELQEGLEMRAWHRTMQAGPDGSRQSTLRHALPEQAVRT